MKRLCEDIKSLIYLYGEGELSEPEKNKLRVHIAECTECSNEYESVLKFKKFVSTAYTPEPNFTEAQVDRILSGINESQKHETHNFLEKILDVFYLPVIRFAMATLVLILTGSFLWQSSLTFSDISKLEKRMQLSSFPQSSNASVFELEKLRKNLKDFYRFVKGDNTFLNLSSNLVIIDRQQFRNLFRIHNELLTLYNKNQKEFTERYPELTRYLLEQLEPEELDSTFINDDVISDLNKILQGETK